MSTFRSDGDYGPCSWSLYAESRSSWSFPSDHKQVRYSWIQEIETATDLLPAPQRMNLFHVTVSCSTPLRTNATCSAVWVSSLLSGPPGVKSAVCGVTGSVGTGWTLSMVSTATADSETGSWSVGNIWFWMSGRRSCWSVKYLTLLLLLLFLLLWWEVLQGLNQSTTTETIPLTFNQSCLHELKHMIWSLKCSSVLH